VINTYRFDAYFDKFNDYLLAETGLPLQSFSHPFMQRHEYYKTPLRVHALEILDVESWQPGMIGSGELNERLIKAIEQKGNNLGRFDPNRFGLRNVPHLFLHNAAGNERRILEIESLIYGFFTSKISDEHAFESFVRLAGGRYSLLAFLFYLKDDRKYVPISPEGFDKVFRNLGVHLVTRRLCSWDNYQQFCAVVAETRQHLSSRLDMNKRSDDEVRLIDAHSYLWTLSWVSMEQPAFQNIPESVEIVKTIAPGLAPLDERAPEQDSNARTVGDPPVIDFVELARLRHIIGRQAEDFVVESERQRLIRLGRSDLAGRVKFVGDDYDRGYDIESFEEDGTARQIEVKTVRVSGQRLEFFISAPELKKAKPLDNYYLYLVERVNGRPYRIRYIRRPELNDSSKFKLQPVDYLVSFDTSS